MLTTHHGVGGGGVEVREAGNALKVQSEVPHLVSLGGGRLSTAVTLHPLPEGRMTVGSGPTVDVLVQGVGVEPEHCYIDNTGGVVTLFPLAEMISVDKVRVMTPTRLTQGSMVCIGRSNYMRFNHPAEARIMRNVLPNASISMVPLNFYNVSIPGVENVDGIDRKPPMAPRRSPRNSWGDASNSSSCNSGSEESCLIAASSGNRGNLAMPLSPKMFPVGTATVNSPAAAVLGSSHTNNLPSYQQSSQPNGIAYNESPMSVYYNQECPIQQSPMPNGVVLRNGFPSNGSAFSQTSNNFNSYMSPKSHGETPTNNPVNNTPSNNTTNGFRSQTPTLISTQTFTNKSFGIQLDSRSVTASPAFEDTRTIAERRLGSLSSLPGINTSAGPTSGKDANEYRSLTTPSPAFNRNPVSSGRNHVYSPRSVTPSPPRPTHGLNGVEHRRTLSASSQDAGEPLRRISSPTPSYGSNHSLEELAARKEELENKRKQAQNDRLREQETEKNERARLEEILSMCADYERQVQLEKQCKSPGIPQSRIKTNGSLPRDKRLPSPGISASEDETDVFTFDQNSSGNASAHASTSPLPVTVVTRALNGNASGVGVARSPYENVVLSAAGIAYPQSPRTRIRTIASKEITPVRDTAEVIENRMELTHDYEFVTSLPRRMSNKSPAPQQATIVNNRPTTPQQATIVNNRPTTPQQHTNVSTIHSPPLNRTPELNGTANNSSPAVSNKISPTPSRKTSDNPKLILPLDINPVDRLSEALEAMKVQNALRNSEKRRSMERKRETEKQDRIVQQCVEESVGEEERQQHIIMLMQTEYAALRKERAKLLAAMSGLKRNVTDIEQQEEELLRELEMERALLDGETAAQSEKHGQEKLRQVELRRRLAELDKEVAQFSVMEVQRQAEREARLETAEQMLHKSEIELGSCEDNAEKLKTLSAQVKAHHELLEQEKKTFEDLEFQYLEQEADCLAGHEELQRELSDVTQRLEARQLRLSELDTQRLEADHAAQLESQGLERQLLSNLRRLEEVRNKLRLIELNMEELSRRGLFSRQDSSPEGSSDNEEYVRPSSAQSPEDIARISRVTKGAPLELGSGSLGRKTLESLQTIERNRQLHLVQQGSQVIENERKRCEELKRRVQDEVRAQWAEEQRQREKNCYSLNSVGSDEASSDVPTESASSDDTVDKRSSSQAAADDKIEQHELDSSAQHNELVMREKELAVERSREETCPLTDGSDYEQQLAVNMRDRDKVARLQHQRPLTRYLPIRSERLDLRHHIETAGHQVDLCPHVVLDTTSCRGHLHKLGAKFHHWGKRWFVFDRNQRTLTYYGDRAEKKPRGGAYFQAIEEVYVDHLNSVKSPNPQLTFVVKTSERTYHLMAPSAEAMRIWVDVVFTGAEGYQEFEHGS